MLGIDSLACSSWPFFIASIDKKNHVHVNVVFEVVVSNILLANYALLVFVARTHKLKRIHTAGHVCSG